MDDEKLAKYPGLQQRNGIWYIRKRIPTDLVAVDNRESIRISLDTTERKVAVTRYALKFAEITAGFERMRKEIGEAGTLSAALTLGRVEMLGRAEIEHLVSTWWARRSASTESLRDNSDDELSSLFGETDFEPVVRQMGPVDDDPFAAIADQLLVEAGFASAPHRVGPIISHTLFPRVDRAQKSYRDLRSLVERAMRLEHQMAQDRANGRITAAFDPLFNPSGVEEAGGPETAGRTVGDMIAAYRAEREALRGKESTDRKYGLLFRVMEEVLGADLPSRNVDRAKCVQIFALLKRLPPNSSKRFASLSLTEAADKAEREGLTGLAANTVSSYMQNLSAVLTWAEKGGWVEKANSKGLVRSRQAQVQRRGYTADELDKLFSALERFRHTEPTKFWVPALAAFTGARAGELCQLRVAEIIEVGGVPCIDLSLYDQQTGELITGNRLKNATSQRIVPIHSNLIAAGFLDFATGSRTNRLFPDLTVGKKGNYTHNFSKWFGRFKNKIGFTQKSLVFHSFRHGFRDACREAGISEETALALGGWARSNQGQKYGNRSQVPLLHKAVEELQFGGFRLPPSPLR